MLVTFKTAANDTFQLEFDEATTVKEMKEKIRAEKGDDFPVENQTLIYGGKILKDEQTVADLGLEEKRFIALMLRTPKPKDESRAESTVRTESETHAEQQKEEGGDAGAAAETVQQADSGQVQLAETQSVVESGDVEVEGLVRQITGMGFPEDSVRTALRIAFNNPERAVEYLTTGFPADQMDTESETVNEDQPEQGVDSLAPLRELPGFARLRRAVQQNPDMLHELLAEMERANPNWIRLINANQQAFVDLLNEEETEGEGAEVPAGELTNHIDARPGYIPTMIQLYPQDVEVIERLKAMGFPENAVVEAYLACDKNENLAANFLLQSLEDDVQEEEEPLRQRRPSQE